MREVPAGHHEPIELRVKAALLTVLDVRRLASRGRATYRAAPDVAEGLVLALR